MYAFLTVDSQIDSEVDRQRAGRMLQELCRHEFDPLDTTRQHVARLRARDGDRLGGMWPGWIGSLNALIAGSAAGTRNPNSDGGNIRGLPETH